MAPGDYNRLRFNVKYNVCEFVPGVLAVVQRGTVSTCLMSRAYLMRLGVEGVGTNEIVQKDEIEYNFKITRELSEGVDNKVKKRKRRKKR